MKALLIGSLLVLAFTTGFTCSKNAPETTSAQTTPEVAPAQEQMAAPADGVATDGAAAPAPETAPAEK